MKSIEEIQRQVSIGQFDLTRHAFQRAIERNISDQEIRETGESLELVEDYPNDKYSPSVLLLGFTQVQRPLHLQASRMLSETTRIITLYEPSEAEWINHRIRRI